MAIETKDKLVTLEDLKASHTYLKSEIIRVDDDKAPVVAKSAVPGSIVTIPDGADGLPVKDLTVSIEPVQDLHGYDNPWPAGGGKNLIPLDLGYLKSINTGGTWNDNIYTFRGIVFTVNTDDGGNVSSIKLNGTTTNSWVEFILVPSNTMEFAVGSYVISAGNAIPNNIFLTGLGKSVSDNNSSVNANLTSVSTSSVYIGLGRSNLAVNNLVIYPMVCFASASDPTTFVPYSNICPISGWTGANVSRTGKNLLNKNSVKNGYLISYNTGEEQYIGSSVCCTGYIPVVAGESYTFVDCGFYNNNVGAFYDKNKHPISSLKQTYTATAPASAKYIRLSVMTVNLNIAQLEAGTVATSYESFGTTIPISWQSSAGTVYGGTLDVTTGVLTVTYGIADLGDYEWSYNANWNGTGAFYIYIPSAMNAKLPVSPSVAINAICSRYKNYDRDALYYNPLSTGFCVNSNGAFTIRDFNYSDRESFTAAMSGVQFVYELATPLVIQLDPVTVNTLLGQNNIWTDTGDILNCKYLVDTNLYYENVIEETTDALNQNMAYTESGDTASRTYVAGDFIVWKGTLYKVTTAIPATTAFVVGSNLVVPTGGLGNELNSIKVDKITGKGLSTNDYTDEDKATLSEVKNTLNHKADVIYDTASGDVASFPDGADGLPVKDLTVSIEPVQDLHGYDNPWVVGQGKNLADPSKFTNRTVSADGNLVNNPARVLTGFISVTPGTTYTASCESGKIYLGCRFYDRNLKASGPNITTAPFTAPDDAAYVCVIFKRSDNANFLPSELTQAQVEAASSPTSYEGYSNICPISGWSGCEIGRTGKNLLDPLINVESGYYIDNNGIVVTNSYMQYTADYIRVKPNTAYCISGNVFGDNHDAYNAVAFYTLSKMLISRFMPSAQGIPANFVTPSDCAYIRFNFARTGVVAQIQVEEGSQPTAFESYAGTTIPITFHDSQGDPLTVYGGTLDVTSGVLTVTHTSVALNTLSWTKSTWNGIVEYFSESLENVIYWDGVRGNIADIQCSHYKPVSTNTAYYNDGMFIALSNTASKPDIEIRDTRHADKNTFVANLAGAQLVYRRKTPQTYQLTTEEVTTLLGQNNIWSDTGAVLNCEYPCDTKLYIQKINAPTDDDMIADAQIASGKYFIVNNNLYLSTTTILAGDPIKPGTNCTLTNLAAALNALNS